MASEAHKQALVEAAEASKAAAEQVRESKEFAKSGKFGFALLVTNYHEILLVITQQPEQGELARPPTTMKPEEFEGLQRFLNHHWPEEHHKPQEAT